MKKPLKLLAAITSTFLLTAFFLPSQSASAVTITAASAVKSLKVSDDWSSSNPKTARAKLSWAKPSSVYGARLIGYRIESSTNKTTWKTSVSNTGSTSTSASVSSGLKPGAPTYFRVRAITSKSSGTKVGSASAVVAKTLSAAPQPPALLGLTKLTPTASGDRVIRWMPQSAAQKGMAATTYRVAATPGTGSEVTCSATTTTQCTLSSLTAGIEYNITLTAKNSRGSEVNINEYQAQDADVALQWYLNSKYGISAPRAWTVTRGSSSVVVAVLDSGISSHPEFEGQLVAGYDFVSDATKSGDGNGRDDNPNDPGDGLDSEPSSWHGTHVAGIIAAKSDASGVTGIAPKVKIQPIRVLGVQGEGSSTDLALAIRWAAGQDLNGFVINGQTISDMPKNETPAKVINMSMAYQPRAGSSDYALCPTVVQAAVDYAQSKGVTLVAAAGNGDTSFTPVANSRVFPTNCMGPLSVGAVGFTGDVAFYSNFGVDLVAPGGDQRNAGTSPVGSRGMIYSTSNEGVTTAGSPTYKLEQGTSMAAPVAAGIIALMYSIRPNIDVKTVWEALKASVQPFPVGSQCAADTDRCGIGLMNAATALEALIAITG